MKTFLLIAIIFSCASFVKGQQGYLGRRLPSLPHSLIVFSGESNSGGYALNSAALPSELGGRGGIQILNNKTLSAFENIHISSPMDSLNNTHVYHTGSNPWGARHGWELGLANMVDSGTLPRPTFIVKTGQGGSSIIEWNPLAAGDFWNTFKSRVDSSISLLTAVNSGVPPPNIFLLYSQGINDHGNGVAVATWKANTKIHFANIRARYGTVPIFITYLPAAYATYNTAITEIASEIADCYPIQTSDLTPSDGMHWTYAGMKVIAARMMYTLKAHYTFN
jgi:hypothetical protein